MPKRSEAYMAQRRRQILDGARACLLSQGWGRTTMDDVAAAAGLSKGAVYTHFASKRALLIGLIELNAEEIGELAEIATRQAFRDRLLAWLALLDGAQGRALAVGQLEIQLEGVRDPELAELIRQGADRLVRIFAETVVRLQPALGPAEAEARALRLIFLLEGMRSFRTLTGEVPDSAMRELVARELDDLWR